MDNKQNKPIVVLKVPEISRRRFLTIAGGTGLAVAGGVALNRIGLEGIIDFAKQNFAEITDPNAREDKYVDEVVRGIAVTIKRGIDGTRYGSENYSTINQLYTKAATKANIAAQNLSWDNPKRVLFGAENIIALMYHAKSLRNANRKQSSDRVQNLSRALSNYEQAESIWVWALEAGKRLPRTVDIRQLRGWGTVADLEFIYRNIEDTLKELIEINPAYTNQYKERIREMNGRRLPYSRAFTSQ